MAPLYAIVFAVSVGAHAGPGAENPELSRLRAAAADVFAHHPDQKVEPLSAQDRSRALAAGALPGQLQTLSDIITHARSVQLGPRRGETPALFDVAINLASRELEVQLPPEVRREYAGRVYPENGDAGALRERIILMSRVDKNLNDQAQGRMSTRLARYRSELGTMNGEEGGAVVRPSMISAASADTRPQSAVYRVPPQAVGSAMTASDLRWLNAQRNTPANVNLRPGNVPASAPASRSAFSSVLPANYTTVPVDYVLARPRLDRIRVGQLMQTARRVGWRRFGGLCLQGVRNWLTGVPMDPAQDARRRQGITAFVGMDSAFKLGRLDEAGLRQLRLQPIRPETIDWSPNDPDLNGFVLVWAPECDREEIHRNGQNDRRYPQCIGKHGAHCVHGHTEYIIPLPSGAPAGSFAVRSDGSRYTGASILRQYSSENPRITHEWVDQNRPNGIRGLGRISQACLTVLAPLDLD
jgi:hypothetical protein